MLGAQSLSPRSLGSPQECPFPTGLLPAFGTITPHVQGHAQPQTRSIPISMSGLLFCPQPSPLALCLQMLTSPTSVSGVQMVGEAVAIRRHGFVWCPHMVCPEQQSRGQGCRGSRWTVATVAAPVGHALHCLVAAWPAAEAVSSSLPTRSRLFLKPPIP